MKPHGYLVIPEELMVLFRREDLSSMELLAVATVHNLARRKEGCTASNEYLSECLNIRTARIQEILAKLIKMGVLRRELNGPERSLFSYYHHPEIDGGLPSGKADGNRLEKQTVAPRGTNTYKDNKGDTRGAGRAQVGGFVLEPKKNPTTSQRLAAEVVTTLMKHRMLAKKPSMDRWAKEIRMLFMDGGKFSKEEVKKVFKWFCEHVDDKYMPRIRRADHIREKYPAVVDHMERATGQKLRDEDRTVENMSRAQLELYYGPNSDIHSK